MRPTLSRQMDGIASRRFVWWLVGGTVFVLLSLHLSGLLRRDSEVSRSTGVTQVEPETGESIFFRSLVVRRSLPDAELKGKRNLQKNATRRAFHGAPPAIPHPVQPEMAESGEVCLACHASGGYAAEFKAFTPVTPHPSWTNCRQCHVAVASEKQTLFRSNEFTAAVAPPIKQAAFKGSPPPILHGLQLREQCVACHAGPGAPAEIRTTHPERLNCLQCHVFQETKDEWVRESVLEQAARADE